MFTVSEGKGHFGKNNMVAEKLHPYQEHAKRIVHIVWPRT